jgi:hypothetical protein
MKEIIITSLKELIANRYLLVLVSVLILVSIIFAISIGFSIHPSEIKVVTHYSSFGGTYRYFDQWFYMFVFVAFGLVAALLHSIIAVKILIVKGRPLAVMFVWLGIGIIFLGWTTFIAVLHV